MPEENANLGEKALRTAAELGLASQLDEVEKIEVNITADPLEIIQGEITAVTLEGEGLVMQKDLRVEVMQLQTQRIAINPLKAVFGQIELQQPTEAKTYVVLTEQDINRAFNSEYLQEKLKNLKIQIEGQPLRVNIERVDFCLGSEGRVGLRAEIWLEETREHKRVAFTALPHVSAEGQRISLADVQYGEGGELSPELTAALLEKASELLDLRNFELAGMSLRLEGFEINSDKITLRAAAQVLEFPIA